jgi:hypothetical protein
MLVDYYGLHGWDAEGRPDAREARGAPGLRPGVVLGRRATRRRRVHRRGQVLDHLVERRGVVDEAEVSAVGDEWMNTTGVPCPAPGSNRSAGSSLPNGIYRGAVPRAPASRTAACQPGVPRPNMGGKGSNHHAARALPGP